MNCMWKWKRSSVKINHKNCSYYLVFLLHQLYGKKDLSHLMIKTYFFYRFDWTIFVRQLPTTDAIPPSLVFEQKVTGIFANEPIYVKRSGLLSKVRIDRQIRIFFFSNILNPIFFNRCYLSCQALQEDLRPDLNRY